MRGIALNLSLHARGAKDGQLREIGENEYKSGGSIEFHLIGETTVFHGDGIQPADGAVRTVDIEFTLVEALEFALDPEGAAINATRKEEKGR